MRELNEVERLKMENYGLKIHVLQQQLQQMIAERQTLMRQIEETHPGYEWRDPYGLVEKEEEEAEDEEAAVA